MHEKTKIDVEKVIKSNIDAIKNPYTKLEFKENPNILQEIQIKSKKDLNKEVLKIDSHLKNILPYIDFLHNFFIDITDWSIFSSIYLLLLSVFTDFKTVLMLAKEWRYTAIMTLIRKIDEALLQIDLFGIEYSKKESKYLEKWLSWKIISHSDCRKEIAKTFESYNTPDVDTDALQSHIYQMISQVSHNSYASMLENISPFTEKVDFEWPTSYHRTLSSIKFTNQKIDSVFVTLKWVYLFVINDDKKYDEIDLLLKNLNPNINDGHIKKDIIDTFGKQKKSPK